MNTNHFSETELQQFALGQQLSGQQRAEHLQTCGQCQQSVETYRALFSALAEQPKAAFAFDLTRLVMPGLLREKVKPAEDHFYIYFFTMILSGVFSMATYLWGNSLLRWVTGILPIGVYLFGITVLIICIFLLFDLHRKYEKKMSTLNIGI